MMMTSLQRVHITEEDDIISIILPHSAPSWILSLAENLASSSLQDGATKWLYYLTGPPHPHPDHTSFFLSNSVRCPHPSMNI